MPDSPSCAASAPIIVAATHGVFVLNARQKLSHPAVREVLVTDTVSVAGKDWPQLHVISIAALIASSLQRILAERGSHNVLGNGATPGSDREAKHERRA
jgi:phosphoribosylpyrophosphate synthetase